MRTASTGYLPTAVSPESITAEVPSRIALATSLPVSGFDGSTRAAPASVAVYRELMLLVVELARTSGQLGGDEAGAMVRQLQESGGD